MPSRRVNCSLAKLKRISQVWRVVNMPSRYCSLGVSLSERLAGEAQGLAEGSGGLPAGWLDP